MNAPQSEASFIRGRFIHYRVEYSEFFFSEKNVQSGEFLRFAVKVNAQFVNHCDISRSYNTWIIIRSADSAVP